MSKSRDLTTGPIWRNLAVLAGPMMFGIIASISVSLIDTFFVGKLGTQPLAALSFTFPVTMTITSLSIGLGAGAASLVSRSIGAKNEKDAKRLATDSLALAIVLVLTISSIGYFTIRPLFGLLGAQQEVLDLVERYMRIWYISMPFLVLPMVANSILRAIGDTFRPSIMMISSSLINMSITPLLIFGWGPIPAMDIEGAAWGTFIAYLFATFYAMWLITYSEEMLSFTRPPLFELIESWKKVAHVGLPAALGNAVNPMGIAVVTAILAGFSEPTVAAFGVATRIESFSVIPMLALSAVIGPVSGQNWGSGNHQRVKQALKQSYAACFAWALFLAAIFALFADPLVAAFAPEKAVQQEASLYLKIVPLSVWGYGWVIVAAGAFNAIGKSILGLGYYLVRTAVFYIPLSWIAALMSDSSYVFIGIACANTLAGISVAALSLWWLNKVGQ